MNIWLPLPIVVLLVTTAACGGPTPPGSSQHAGELATANLLEENELTNEATCGGPLPSGSVTFRGTVVDVRWDGGASSGATNRWMEVDVRVEKIRARPDTATWKIEYVPNEVVTAIVLDPDAASVVREDCVVVSGRVSRWACGPACDAAGFVAERIVVQG